MEDADRAKARNKTNRPRHDDEAPIVLIRKTRENPKHAVLGLQRKRVKFPLHPLFCITPTDADIYIKSKSELNASEIDDHANAR
jgi:hypothetical protein